MSGLTAVLAGAPRRGGGEGLKPPRAATRYPPDGIRGMAGMSRATRYGTRADYARHANAEVGVIVQLGGQTALKLAEKLDRFGIPIVGTSYQSLDLAEDRGRFSTLLHEHGIPYPRFDVITRPDEAVAVAEQVGDVATAKGPVDPDVHAKMLHGDSMTPEIVDKTNTGAQTSQSRQQVLDDKNGQLKNLYIN